MKKTSLFKIFSILVIFALALVGCSAGGSKTNNESSDNKQQKIVKKDGKDITIAVAADFTTMDPYDTNDTLSYSVQKTMLQGLIGFDKDMKVVPVLAEEYSSNDEATEFTFKLRKGITFHDGTPFNAEAVKVNLDRATNPNSTLIRSSLFSVIKETVVVDEYTVKVILSEPFGAMINTFAHPAAMMISPKAIAEYGDNVAQHPVGTGPYVFKDWQPGDHLTVVKNSDYWNATGNEVDSITFKPTPENGTRIAMLQAGDADLIYPVPTESIDSIKGKEGIIVENDPSIVVYYLSMNTMKKPFDDVRVRQAINYAINKDAFIGVVHNGYASPLKSVIAPNTQFYSEQKGYDFDLEKAKKLMAEAGYADGFTTTLWGSNASSTMKAMEFLQQQLAQINIKVKIESMESGTLADKIWNVQTPEEAEIELYYGGWSPSTGDADWGIRPLLGGANSFPPSSYNTAYYNNEEVNQLIGDALKTADSSERGKIYAKIQEKIWKDAPWAFLAVTDTTYGHKNYLKGAFVLPDGSLNVDQMKIVQ